MPSRGVIPRIVLPWVLLLGSGAILNALIAQAFGWWGQLEPPSPIAPFPWTGTIFGPPPAQPEFRIVSVGDHAGVITIHRQAGVSLYQWKTQWPWDAVQLGVATPAAPDEHGRPLPKFDPASSVPSWLSVWDPTARSRQWSMDALAKVRGGQMEQPRDYGIGWPAISFVVHEDALANGASHAGAPKPDSFGGHVSHPATGTTVKVLAWRPVFPGVILGSLFWTTPILLLGIAKRAIQSASRKRAGRCCRCAYSLVGLPPGSPCPECGTPR